MHLFGNVLATFMFMSRLEHTLGAVKILVVYLVSGIVANIFSDSVNADSLKVGASTSLYGVIGCIIGYVIINWRGIELLGPVLRCKILCSTVFIFVFILIFTPGSVQDSSIDFMGHLGGFLAGLFLESIHNTILDSTR